MVDVKKFRSREKNARDVWSYQYRSCDGSLSRIFIRLYCMAKHVSSMTEMQQLFGSQCFF